MNHKAIDTFRPKSPPAAPRLLAVSSGGGHWIQLQRLRPAFEGFDVAFVSVTSDHIDDLQGERLYTVRDVTRRNPQDLALLVPQMIYIMLKEKPDVVLTTGAAPGLIAIAVAKMITRAKTMWIDSIANCERLSSSGLHARRFADCWLTQWPNLARPEGPSFWGSVL